MVRSANEVVSARASLREEMAGGDLGDARLNERRNRLIAVLEHRPDAGFPDACASDSEVEALYRFLRNRRISLDAVMAPHLMATSERCRALGEVLVIHDTTELSFAGETARVGLSRQSTHRQGFWLHAALAVSADGLRAPLGLVAVRPFTRAPRAPGTPTPSWTERFADPTKESRRWAAGVATVRTRLGDAIRPLHLMDREGDSDERFADLLQHGARFIIRLTHDRRVVPDQEAGTPDTLRDAVPQTDWLFERAVYLAPRAAGTRPKEARERHPPRAGRSATLRFAARRVTLKRPAPHGASFPATRAVHVIVGWEVGAPPGQTPVEWRLITTEPIDTVAHVMRIVDWYRARGVIEEFFKCLKTGCAYEKRQLERLETLLVALALLAPIAWQLLLLRHLARALPDTPADVALTPRQLHVLRATPVGATLPPRPTLRDALRAVARLGGHLRQNGEPGWLVLARGMQKLRCMEVGWAAAERAGPM